jgi:hypothetical protein
VLGTGEPCWETSFKGVHPPATWTGIVFDGPRCIARVAYFGCRTLKMALTLQRAQSHEHYAASCRIFAADDTNVDEDMMNFGFDFSDNFLDAASSFSSCSSLSSSGKYNYMVYIGGLL